MNATAAVTAEATIMAEPEVYLEKISAFSRMLRLEGFAVGPQETADACRILAVLGFEDKQQVKTALRTVYAKSREEQSAFDRVFEGFFVSEETMRKQAKEQMQREQEMAKARQEAQQTLKYNGTPMDLTDDQRETYAAMPEEAREKLRQFMDRYKESAARSPELYSNFIHSVFAKTLMEQQIKMEDAALNGMALDPDVGLMYRDISQFKETEIPKAIAVIQEISQQINGELAAKRKNRGRSGKLDFRRTIRKGLETGGSFYRLKYKKKRQRKKHLVLLCDVSGSMVQFSEFALRFVQSMDHVAESSRTFLFSEDLIEADPFSLQNMDLFRDYVRQSGMYGKGTDLASALETICAMQPAALNDSTTLLIISDTKTVDQHRAAHALLEANRMAGRILWLNPIPESRWQYLKSAKIFASVCTMVSCATLSDLANACRRLAQQ